MSAEFSYHQPEQAKSNEHYQRLAVIQNIRSEMTNTIRELQMERPLEGNDENLLKFIALSIHMKRIDELSDDILLLSEEGQVGRFVNLNPAAFITGALEGTQQLAPRVYQERNTEVMEIITANTHVGTEAVLNLLLPPAKLDPVSRDLHFFPWRRDLLDRTDHTINHLSNGASITMRPTALSNIAIVSVYRSDAQFPHRIAQVIE